MSPAEQVRRLYEEAESRTAAAMENLVGTDAFADLLAMVTQNAMAMTKIASDGLDGLLVNLRIAGRTDIARLGRQVARTEDKLELLLQAVEALEDRIRAGQAAPAPAASPAPAGATRAGAAAASTRKATATDKATATRKATATTRTATAPRKRPSPRKGAEPDGDRS